MKLNRNIFVGLLFGCFLVACTREDPAPTKPVQPIDPIPVEVGDITKPVLQATDFALDTIKLSFSEPVKLLFVKDRNAFYDVDITDQSFFKYSQDSASVKFRCIPCELGRDYELEYSAKDTADNVNQEPFVVSYYLSKLKLHDWITHSQIDDERNVYYAITKQPDSKLSVVSLADFKVIDEATLDFLPFYDRERDVWKITRNPFNGYFYIYSMNFKSIYIYSLETKSLIKTFEITPDEGFLPSVYPKGMTFTISGMGLINTVSEYGGGDLLRTINSADGEKTQVVGEDQVDSHIFWIHAIRPNRDHSKLFIDSESRAYIEDPSHHFYFDGETNEIRKFFNTGSGFSFIVPNRKNDLLYMAGYYEQFIMDLNEVQSVFSSHLSPSTADFSYEPGEEDHFAYLRSYGTLYLLDYKNQKEIFAFNVYLEFTNLTNTIDGKTMIMLHRNELYFFDLPKFRRTNI